MPSRSEANYDIFICYRREGGAETAKHLRDILTERGYRVFFDTDSLRSGDFNRALLEVIAGCTDFIIILSPGSLDRCSSRYDWVRQELGCALAARKNVIPIMSGGFTFPARLPADIDDVRWKNGIEVNFEYFDAMVEKLVSFLHSRPVARKRQVPLAALVAALAALGVAVAFSFFRGGGQAADAGRSERSATSGSGQVSQQDEQAGAEDAQDVDEDADPQDAESPGDPMPSSPSDGEYLLPESDSRYYSREELEQLTDWELWMARNELYARHGRKFNNQEAQDYFYSKSWYVGLYDPNEYDTKGVPKVYNDYERQNRALIEQIEAERDSIYAQ